MHPNDYERTGFVATAVSCGVLAVGLLATVASVPMAWLVWPLGYGVVLPVSVGYVAAREREEPTDEPDSLATLQERYVTGEVDAREFERELERVLTEEEER